MMRVSFACRLDKKRDAVYNSILNPYADRKGGGRMQTRRRHRRRRSPAGLILLLCVLAMLVFAYAALYPRQASFSAHPVRYEQLVQAAAKENGLDQAHVYAVILCESSFRPEVVSSAGAMGLMQIMPDTGRWIAGKFGEEDAFSQEMLFSPETNIKYGCWFLGWLYDRYDGDIDTVSAAYHAGAGNVKKWLADPAYSADGKTIDTTPYPATNSYMKKVRSAYEVYKEKLDG